METSAATVAAPQSHRITTPEHLENILGGPPHPDIIAKATPHTTPLVREFIRHARFFVLATADAAGRCDSSPRGDLTSVVRMPDEHTLILPDRPGNRRGDSYRNILANPHVGILFIVPGLEEVVRVNGRATLTTDPELCTGLALAGRPAQLAMIVRIDEVYTHCARAMLRGKVWQPDTWVDHGEVPALREMIHEQLGIAVPDDAPPARAEEYRDHLY
ncbi:MSMEG_1061 family FMN-dependent PPOX-type flavoprotein [Tomitella fengzijianii]|uniref:Pyridoxamine 5'-phosphate oxidase family protein n=1 Tax=Tomitella fengzijianii TaxID=2597660 RepID=A0A516WZF7_9ACTN|nr:MSMEG_1061 family FMN-dependent PPOX-type flavoprotein [Tomitella fengzijianii]QDQ96229.1 pyridoxamine 5'-phosphate oxidase family protein [Tomitella fengzijianii]